MIDEDEVRGGQAERLRIWQERERNSRENKEVARRQFEAGFGPFVAGEYQIDQVIIYRSKSGGLHRGRVLWSYGPSKTPVTGRQRPLLYVVTGEKNGGLPVEVEPGQIIQG